MIVHQLLGNPVDFNSKIFQHWRRTARSLADARTDEFLRTCLVIAVYIFVLVAAFIPRSAAIARLPQAGVLEAPFSPPSLCR